MVNFSDSDVKAYYARQLAKKIGYEGASEGCDDEAELHEEIKRECMRRGWLALHGSMAHKTFRTEGEPDYVILCNEGRLLLIECKTRTGKLSPAQLAVKAWAARLSHEVHTVRSIEEFHRIANQVTKPPHDTATDAGIPPLRHVRD